MTTAAWIAALVLVGLAVMVLEVFVPSGGVLGFLSVVALVAAVVMAFAEQGPAFGMAVLGVVFLAVPAVLAAAFRVFPHTPLGRRVLPPPPSPDDVRPGAGRRRQLEALVGRRGRTTGELLPWGTVEIGGTACDAVSETGPIAAGAAVEVVGVNAAAVVVRQLPAGDPPAGPSRPEQPAPPAGDGRSPTLETFDFDGLGPPAA